MSSGLSIVMLLFVACLWNTTVPDSIRPLVVWIGRICFLGLIPTALAGLIVLAAGIILRYTH